MLSSFQNTHIYILHAGTCHPRRCSTSVNDILKWQWAHTETTADRCLSICGSACFCCLLSRTENSSAISHLGKQVIAISIIYSNIQQSQSQTILTRRQTEMNASSPPPPTHQFLFSSHNPAPPSTFETTFFLCSLAHFLFCPFCLIFNQQTLVRVPAELNECSWFQYVVDPFLRFGAKDQVMWLYLCGTMTTEPDEHMSTIAWFFLGRSAHPQPNNSQPRKLIFRKLRTAKTARRWKCKSKSLALLHCRPAKSGTLCFSDQWFKRDPS